ncbi:MAG: 30S ribosome-binding factor RbfA [Tissierellia bacterium]|nr:30S ribosome-binding factor RbfA [Tissierellia bacterium]
MNSKRLSRIGSEIKKVISELILESIKDPRVSDMTTISDVKVSKDLGYADIAVSILGDDKVKSETLEGLNNAKGFIKKELGQRLDLRHIPEIRFEIDDTVEKGMHIEELISKIRQEENNE